jgi:hypothetical protein
MSLGAFAGGVVRGLQASNDIINTNKRTAIAEEDGALRKRASDREETRYQRELSDQAKKDQLEKDLAENVNLVFGKPAAPESTGTMTGPLDARDARAGTMAGVQTQYNIPAQEATGDGGMGGVNLMDPANHGKLLKLEALNMQSRMRNGLVKPEEVRQYAEWGKKMEADGMSQALGRFIMGDTKAMDEIAKKNGVRSYETQFGKDESGYPALNFVITKENGDKQVVPAAILAAGLGATGFVNTLDKLEDNATNRYKAQALGGYYERMAGAAEDRNDIAAGTADARVGIERDKADAYIGTQGALKGKYDRWQPGAGKSGKQPADPSTVMHKAIKNLPAYLPKLGKSGPLDKGDPVEDSTGMERLVEVGSYMMSSGKDAASAEATARGLLRRANEAAQQQVGDKAKPEEFVKVRDKFLDAAIQSAKKSNKPAAPAGSGAMKIDPATQKARDTDKVGILRNELTTEQQKLAEIKAKPGAKPEDVSRIEKNVEAITRELENSGQRVAALRTR